MNARRRACWLALSASLWPAAARASSDDDQVDAQRVLRFPRDHGAHPGARIEWWYVTGWLTSNQDVKQITQIKRDQLIGFQVTFFRSRTGLAADLPGRLAPRQLLFAHAAVSDLASGRYRHAQRIGRWSGQAALPDLANASTSTSTSTSAAAPAVPSASAAESTSAAASAAMEDLRVRLAAWRIERESAADGQGLADTYRARVAAPEAGFTLDVQLSATQPLLLQGDSGYSRKGPPPHASHYVSHPQLAVRAQLTLDGRARAVQGRAWFDHEWSDSLLPPGAVGWDWIGINLADGSALTAFVMRAADGRSLWAGGSHRSAGGRHPAGGAELKVFEPGQVRFTPQRLWTSAVSGASYPVQWRIDTPAGSHVLEALLDAQELDSRGSTGSAYWEGLSELRDLSGQRVGLGFLEMTGRAGALRLG